MKPRTTTLLLSAALLLLVASCDKCQAEVNRQAEATTSATTRTGTAVELRLIRGQIEIYRRMHNGENPPSLEAMETLPRLKYADDYSYDPTTGVITSKRFPNL